MSFKPTRSAHLTTDLTLMGKIGEDLVAINNGIEFRYEVWRETEGAGLRFEGRTYGFLCADLNFTEALDKRDALTRLGLSRHTEGLIYILAIIALATVAIGLIFL